LTAARAELVSDVSTLEASAVEASSPETPPPQAATRKVLLINDASTRNWGRSVFFT
jgi:hypothetical protein